MNNKRIQEILKGSQAGNEITVRGWVRTKRDSKSVCFLEINDGSCLSNLQVVIEKNSCKETDEIERANTGASVVVSGILQESPGKNQTVELAVTDLSVAG